jgi:hypothetical protein
MLASVRDYAADWTRRIDSTNAANKPEIAGVPCGTRRGVGSIDKNPRTSAASLPQDPFHKDLELVWNSRAWPGRRTAEARHMDFSHGCRRSPKIF